MLPSAAMLMPLLLAAAPAKDDVKTLAPDAAIALAETSKRAQTGRFEMTVRATGRAGGATFLNSTPDYRSPDCLSFRLSSNVVKTLTRRYGEAPETYFRGKHVVVDGTLRRELIVNKNYGRIESANRWQHTVRILFPHQLVAVD